MGSEKIEQVRARLADWGVEGLLVTNLDNIHYLSGFTGSMAYIVITEQQALFLTDGRYITQVRTEVEGFELRGYQGKALEGLIENLQELALTRLGFEADSLLYSSYQILRDGLSPGGIELVPLTKAIEALRLKKNGEELSCIKKAISLAATALQEVRSYIRPGIKERDLAVELEYRLRRLGAENIPFETIVVSGPRSALPHGKPSDKVLRPGEMVTIDWGCSYQGYHADITRTFILADGNTGQLSRQREIYQLILTAQSAAIAACRPGVSSRDIDAACRQIISEAGYAPYFSHGTGHGIGRAVHEDPLITWYDGTPVEEGMVFTIEPGVYIPDWGGIRIEDMVLVNSRGCEVLTDQISKDWEVLG